MAFKLADKFGYSPPFQFPEEQEEDLIPIESQTTNNIHIRIRFVSNKTYAKRYENAFINNIESNDFFILANKNTELEIDIFKVKQFTETGLTHNNITTIYKIALGKDLIEAIESDKTLVDSYIKQALDWIGILPSKKREVWKQTMKSMIFTYIEDYKDYTPPNGFDAMFNIFQLCLKIGIIDISNIAGFVSDEIFFTLAKNIREQKLSDNRWNPALEDYNPLFNSFKGKYGIADILDPLIQLPKVVLPENNTFSTKDLDAINSLPELLFNAIDQVVQWFKNFITKLLNSIVEKADHIIKMYNAFMVGFINGIIELVASIVDAIGFMISLFEFKTQSELVAAITQFVNTLSWETIKDIIKKTLKELFKFLQGEDSYENAKEFGEFIPKLLELVIDAVTIGKAASKGLKTMADIVKVLPVYKTKANNAIKQIELAFKLKGINKKILQSLQEKGLTLNVKLIPTQQLNVGVPTKFFDGKRYTVKYQNTTLKIFNNEKDANNFLKKLDGDKKFFNSEIKKAKIGLYGTTGFSKIALEYRKTLPNPKHSGNIAVFEYIDKKGELQQKAFTTLSKRELPKGVKNGPHAEIIGIEWIKEQGIPTKNVKQIYSELEPCSLKRSKCKEKLKNAFPGAEIEYTFEYPGIEKAPQNLIIKRRQSIIDRKQKLNELIK